MAVNPEGTRMLQQVKEGMQVHDAHGDEVGTVSFVHYADPEAVTTESDRGAGERGDHGDGTLVEPLIGDEDSKATERMRLTGYIRIDAKGWFTGDKYVGADHVTRVDSDSVTLEVDKDQL
jgi:hypothetical protein